jgi:acyl carrier protein
MASRSDRDRKAAAMASTETSPRVVEQVLFAAMAEMGAEPSAVRREATFEDLDLDSLDMVELAQIVESEWGIELDPEDFGNVETIGQALDMVLARMP